MNVGLCALGAGIAVGLGSLCSLGEGMVCSHAIDGMSRNPEMVGALRSNMIVAVALCESTAIYSLVVAILIIFLMGMPALAAL